MVVAMVTMRVMQTTVHKIIGVIAMRHSLVATAGPVLVRAFGVRRAAGRVGRRDRDYVLIDMIAVHVVQMAVMEIVHMAVMTHGGMAAIRTMLVGVIGMVLFGASAHGLLLPLSFESALHHFNVRLECLRVPGQAHVMRRGVGTQVPR
jgi:hypothetical protein